MPGSSHAVAGSRGRAPGRRRAGRRGRTPVAEIAVEEPETIIEGEPGVEIVLRIRRDAEERQIRLVRARWL